MAKGDNLPRAFMFWYKVSENAQTEYFYIIAFTYKQAMFTWRQWARNCKPYDYDTTPCDIVEGRDFVKYHEVGEILGDNAIL